MSKESKMMLTKAARIALIGALISLLFCTFLFGSNIFEKAVPLITAVVFAAAYILLGRIKTFKRIAWLRPAVLAFLAIASGVCLHFFC